MAEMDPTFLKSLLDRINGQCHTGSMRDNRPNGQGKFAFSSGITYEGNFLEGSFDGAGTMFFPKNESGGGGGRFVAKWKNGKLVKGTYFFEDDLEYKNKDWQYCTSADRRFWTEIQHGIQIADQPRLKNNVPPQNIPLHCLDMGDGYYDPSDQCKYRYDGTFDRVPTAMEAAWALRKARAGIDQPLSLSRPGTATAAAAAAPAASASSLQGVAGPEVAKPSQASAAPYATASSASATPEDGSVGVQRPSRPTAVTTASATTMKPTAPAPAPAPSPAPSAAAAASKASSLPSSSSSAPAPSAPAPAAAATPAPASPSARVPGPDVAAVLHAEALPWCPATMGSPHQPNAGGDACLLCFHPL